jgi:hypothetical protein
VKSGSAAPIARLLFAQGERQVYSPWALEFVAKRKFAPSRENSLQVLARGRRFS